MALVSLGHIGEGVYMLQPEHLAKAPLTSIDGSCLANLLSDPWFSKAHMACHSHMSPTLTKQQGMHWCYLSELLA